jgi:5-oxoprolinase (ATP-hydrolysing) subunit C
MPSLTISQLKGKASFQDLGRNTAQHLGFSGSGAADEYSYLLANQLIGNKLIENQFSAAALEITFGQLSLIANEACQLVITGADCQPYIEFKNGKELVVKNNKVFTLSQGDTLNLAMPRKQLHSYIAISGGFSATHWLNSASQTKNEYTLEFGEAELTKGTKLHFSADSSSYMPVDEHITKNKTSHNFHQSEQLVLRFLPSPLWLTLTPHTQQLFLNQRYQISPKSNRMGYRLLGKPLIVKNVSQTLSKPINYGTIQLPNDGQPIVLMKERQTIGGYPTLGTVIQTDLFRLSQKRPCEKIRFISASLEHAQAQLFAFRERFRD